MRTAARIAALTLNTLLLVYGLWSLYLVRRILFWSDHIVDSGFSSSLCYSSS
jgi:hypothetical protein